ncbi:similar to protein phosphatase 1, regulatory subunit 11 [Cyanidioschyzon merolae strain 10D]|uniref:Similar to protein phosphatase 1, regulatory subunit 11 n=1 Tax=Cyanidioschyzon merolae (strain NIES-3377 / 10D) TaxID=280699 RepID=M1V6N5_CYAM1|nr:similar to protein phosphatase 1, regulatory subunit 11 [Cyanidioschyzon merolae strain 10D]BAM82325.1 similar to protein phosphatase 1, regulatory subunit 11 [Cyanidioschyzon merolae strain 10D]|eukprot:XP_005538361.1 similar to protein phosphatase 1, regulatory subunit 11 [Cyanidioschyzon merolae strain 10D]
MTSGNNHLTAAAATSRTELVETPVLRLRLRARPQVRSSTERHVRWSDDTVDNEHACKRKSKKCCIYHKPHSIESSSDSSSSDDDDDDDDIDCGESSS